MVLAMGKIATPPSTPRTSCIEDIGMIITRLNGGLGNQLFQYAFGRALSIRHGAPLRLDIRDYRENPQHGLLIQNFNIDGEFLPTNHSIAAPDITRRTKWQRWLWNMNPSHARWVREKPFGFQPQWLKLGKSVYLDGYWQSESFFRDFSKTLRNELTLKAPPSLATQEIAAQMRQTRSVAMHIRRGDYVTDPKVAKIYLPLSLAYYERCLNDWAADQRNVRVFVFSNDIAWCKKNIRWAQPTVYVDHTTALTAYEDLYLMQQAECCITANSTLSWWGAWLGRRPNHVVYTPANWFYPNTLDDQYLPCDGWVQMPIDPISAQTQMPSSHAA